MSRRNEGKDTMGQNTVRGTLHPGGSIRLGRARITRRRDGGLDIDVQGSGRISLSPGGEFDATSATIGAIQIDTGQAASRVGVPAGQTPVARDAAPTPYDVNVRPLELVGVPVLEVLA